MHWKTQPPRIIISIPALLLLALLVTGCEGYRCGEGVVFDKATTKPLDSVFCENLTGVQTMYTDSAGRYELCNRISGCVPHCKDITIRFSKPGYKTAVVDNPEKSSIYLEK